MGNWSPAPESAPSLGTPWYIALVCRWVQFISSHSFLEMYMKSHGFNDIDIMCIIYIYIWCVCACICVCMYIQRGYIEIYRNVDVVWKNYISMVLEFSSNSYQKPYQLKYTGFISNSMINYHVLPISVCIKSTSIDIYLGANPRGGGSQFQSG